MEGHEDLSVFFPEHGGDRVGFVMFGWERRGEKRRVIDIIV
jgi:hypothetical protein